LLDGSRQRKDPEPGSPLLPLTIVVPIVLSAAIAVPFVLGKSADASAYVALMVLSAVVPGLLVLYFFIRSDRFPEPPGVIFRTFVLGVCAPIAAAVAAEILGKIFDGRFAVLGSLADPLLRAVVHAAIPEETMKFLILVLYCARHSEFNEPMDGLVYGVTASMGFATLENVMYVLHDPTWPGWMHTAIIRGLITVPAHAVDGAVMGFFVGMASALPVQRTRLLVAGWAVPVALHAVYDLPVFLVKGQDQDWVAVLKQLWFYGFLLEVWLALRLLRKLEEIQRGADPGIILRQIWRAVRNAMRLWY